MSTACDGRMKDAIYVANEDETMASTEARQLSKRYVQVKADRSVGSQVPPPSPDPPKRQRCRANETNRKALHISISPSSKPMPCHAIIPHATIKAIPSSSS